MLQDSADVVSIVAVAIAHAEEVAMPELQHMGVSQVCILILLVGIVGGDATLCGKTKLGDNI